jgi:hypothetical protein
MAGVPSGGKKRKNKKNRNPATTGMIAELPGPEVEAAILLEEQLAAPVITPIDIPAADLEEARAEAFTCFDEALGDLLECYINDLPVDDDTERTLDAMETYRGLTGHYPYAEVYSYSAAAFTRYLRAEGIQPEIYEDVRRHVTSAIIRADKAPFWDALRDALVASEREWPDKELFLLSVAPGGGARVLGEAAQLGFVDHRLEHAIILIQRAIRFRRDSPPSPHDRGEWLAAFEKLHHAPDPNWVENGVHLASFAETTRRFEGYDSDYELSFVAWNRRCIPEFIVDYARTYREFFDHELTYGIDAALRSEHVGSFVDDSTGVRIEELVAAKRDRLYRLKLEYLLDDDALAKTNVLIRVFAEGNLDKPRNPRRDVLKFIGFALNEPTPSWVPTDGRLGRSTAVAQCYLERLDSLPFYGVEEIFRALPKCLASYGRDLLHRFSKLDVGTLGAAEVRTWFLELVIDEVADLCSDTQVDEKTFRSFLSEGAGRKFEERAARNAPQASGALAGAVELARERLQEVTARVRGGKPLYDYTIWVEPVKVSAVVLPDEREAKLGSRV